MKTLQLKKMIIGPEAIDLAFNDFIIRFGNARLTALRTTCCFTILVKDAVNPNNEFYVCRCGQDTAWPLTLESSFLLKLRRDSMSEILASWVEPFYNPLEAVIAAQDLEDALCFVEDNFALLNSEQAMSLAYARGSLTRAPAPRALQKPISVRYQTV